MQVAEIAVRLGDTLIETRHLVSGAFRIGTGRDVDLAVTGLTSFPLVDWTERGCMLRVPAGLRAERFVEGLATPFDGSVVLGRGDQISITIDMLVIRVSLVERVAPLARPSINTTWPRWIFGALVAHLIALFTIHALADPDPEGVRVVSVASFIAQLPEPPDPTPTSQARSRSRRPSKQLPAPRIAAIEPQQELPPASEPTPEPARRRARALAGARKAGILGGISADDIRAITGTKDIAKELSEVGPIYRDYEAEQKGFGGGRRFDPTKDPRFNSVETGRYATVSKGRATGDHYALPGEVAARPKPRVAHCAGACIATGGLDREVVRGAIARHDEAILGCYERQGNSQRGDVVVDLTIGEDGKVVTSDGAGLGSTGNCVAGVVRRVAFPKAAPTTVRYPFSFSPS